MLDSVEKVLGKERVATVVNESKTPSILKVRHNVESKESYAAWIHSDAYKKLDERSLGMLRDHHPELLPAGTE